MQCKAILICCILLVLSTCQSHKPQESTGKTQDYAAVQEPGSKYTLFAEFAATQGDIFIAGDTIKVYSLTQPEGALYTPRLLSDTDTSGQDEPYYHYSGYLWKKDKFLENQKDSLRYIPHGKYNIDQDNAINLPVKNPVILEALRKANLHQILIKQDIRADLDADGVLDDILVYSEPETGELGYRYGIIIIQRVSGKPLVTYRYISQVESYVGRLEVKDITGDGTPDLILYEMDYAASGYTLYAQVFGLDTGQKFVAYGDEGT